MARRIKKPTWGTGLRFDKKKGYYVKVQIGVDEDGDPIYTKDYFNAKEVHKLIAIREKLIKEILKLTEKGKTITRREALAFVKKTLSPASYKDRTRKRVPGKAPRPVTDLDPRFFKRLSAHFPKLTINVLMVAWNEEAERIFWEFYPAIDYGVAWAVVSAMGLNPGDFEDSSNDSQETPW